MTKKQRQSVGRRLWRNIRLAALGALSFWVSSHTIRRYITKQLSKDSNNTASQSANETIYRFERAFVFIIAIALVLCLLILAGIAIYLFSEMAFTKK